MSEHAGERQPSGRDEPRAEDQPAPEGYEPPSVEDLPADGPAVIVPGVDDGSPDAFA
jgi:hypothetical protein